LVEGTKWLSKVVNDRLVALNELELGLDKHGDLFCLPTKSVAKLACALKKHGVVGIRSEFEDVHLKGVRD
jgi:hypothetical protein